MSEFDGELATKTDSSTDDEGGKMIDILLAGTTDRIGIDQLRLECELRRRMPQGIVLVIAKRDPPPSLADFIRKHIPKFHKITKMDALVDSRPKRNFSITPSRFNSNQKDWFRTFEGTRQRGKGDDRSSQQNRKKRKRFRR